MSLLIGEDLRRLFHQFEHTAFRLEVRESYYEKEQLGQFLSGQEVDLAYMATWLELVTVLRAAGKRVERVRVVSQPHSDYTRYGLWLCQYNVAAGEDIRYLPREQAGGLPNHDYWLFDSHQLYEVVFDKDDGLLGASRVDDVASVVQHCFWRDAAWHHAVPYGEYVKMTGRATQHSASA